MVIILRGTKMTESDHDYFRRRAAEERAAGERAIDPLARRAHLELAGRYDEVAGAVKGVAAKVQVTERVAQR
jgi:hypothetical protein